MHESTPPRRRAVRERAALGTAAGVVVGLVIGVPSAATASRAVLGGDGAAAWLGYGGYAVVLGAVLGSVVGTGYPGRPSWP